jgi:Helix-hairpin-helix domain
MRPGYHSTMAHEHSGDQRPPGDTQLLSNGELARIFHEIGDMLEVKGELVFKTVAYHKAADAIAHSPVEVSQAYAEGHPPRIPGVGEAISKSWLGPVGWPSTTRFARRFRRAWWRCWRSPASVRGR